MTLKELGLKICGAANDGNRCKFAACGGSIYSINSLTIKNYPLFFLSPTKTHTAKKNTTTFHLTGFYLDRMMSDQSNDIDIMSAGVEFLKNLILKIQKIDGVISVSSDNQCTVYTETEAFDDLCGGCYIEFDVVVKNDTVCAS